MNKLQRIRSTDLTVLRSILVDEADNNLLTSTDVNHEESTSNDMSKLSNCIDGEKSEPSNNKNDKNQKLSISTKTFTPDKPFIITRIESKHKSNIENKMPSRQKSSTNLYSSQNEFPVYKSIHYRDIVEKENRLVKKYQELYKVLNRDILMRTVSLCDQYINDGRQLVQNSLATSRIVSSFIEDMSHSPDRMFKQSMSSPLGNINSDWKPALSSVENQDQYYGHLPRDPLIKTRESISIPPSDSKGTRTNHVLDSEEPSIRQWLERKKRQMSFERQMKREEDKIENVISIGAVAVQERRKAEADDAFNKWIATKKIHAKKCYDNADGSTDDLDSEVGLPQAGRQPKPATGISRRQTTFLLRPKSSATFAIHNNVKMKVMGQPVSLVSSETSRLPSHIDYSKPFRKTDLLPLRPETAVPQSRKKNVLSASQPILQKEPKKKHKKKKSKPVNDVNGVGNLDIDAERESLESLNLGTPETIKWDERNINSGVESDNHQHTLLDTEIRNSNVLLVDGVTNSSKDISEDLSNFSDEDLQFSGDSRASVVKAK